MSTLERWALVALIWILFAPVIYVLGRNIVRGLRELFGRGPT